MGLVYVMLLQLDGRVDRVIVHHLYRVVVMVYAMVISVFVKEIMLGTIVVNVRNTIGDLNVNFTVIQRVEKRILDVTVEDSV
jgi:hypothetical protein